MDRETDDIIMPVADHTVCNIRSTKKSTDSTVLLEVASDRQRWW